MNSIGEFISKRETDQNSSGNYLEQALIWDNLSLKVLIIQNFHPEDSRISNEKVGPEPVWIRSKDNFIVSIDKKGKAVFGTIFPSSSSWLILTKRNELAFKAFFSTESLIIALKRKQENILRFYNHSYSNLLQRNKCRREIMKNSYITISQLDQFDIEKFLVVLKKYNKISIWNILSEDLQFQFEIPNGYEAQYSNSSVLYWKLNQDGIDLHIKFFHQITELHFFVRGVSTVNFISLVKNLIICVGINKISFIDWRNSSIFEIQISPIFQIYIPDSNDGIIINTGETMMFLTDHGTILNIRDKYPVMSDTKDIIVVFSDETSQIFVITKAPVRIVACVDVPRTIKVSVVGINESTNQIFIGTSNGNLLLLN